MDKYDRTAFDNWKRTITRGASTRAIAERMNTNGPRIKRHIEDADPPVADTVIELARAYGVNPVEGLIAAGLLSRAEVDHAAARDALSSVPMLQLLEEAVERERRAVGANPPETPEQDRKDNSLLRRARRREIGERML